LFFNENIILLVSLGEHDHTSVNQYMVQYKPQKESLLQIKQSIAVNSNITAKMIHTGEGTINGFSAAREDDALANKGRLKYIVGKLKKEHYGLNPTQPATIDALNKIIIQFKGEGEKQNNNYNNKPDTYWYIPDINHVQFIDDGDSVYLYHTQSR